MQMKAIEIIREHKQLPFALQNEQRIALYEKLRSFEFEQLAGELRVRINDSKATDPAEVRILVNAIARNGGSRAFDIVFDLLKEEHYATDRVANQIIRRAVINVLGMIGDQRAVIPLTEILYSDNGIFVLEAAEALAKIGDPIAINDLQVVYDKRLSKCVEEGIYPHIPERLSTFIRLLGGESDQPHSFDTLEHE